MIQVDPEAPAIVVGERTWSHGDLARGTAFYRRRLEAAPATIDAAGEPKVALLCEPGPEFVAALRACWAVGAVAVPLCERHPPDEWDYVLRDTAASAAWVSPVLRPGFEPVAQRRGVRLLDAASWSEEELAEKPPCSEDPPEGRAATVVYTSGTTGRPKGAVVTHSALRHRLEVLWRVWEFRAEDRVLHVLPLHHVHGLENALLCPLRGGASVELVKRFEAAPVWERLASGAITVFMGVPTHYAKLLAAFDAASAAQRETWSRAAGRLRLAVSGSAALPTELLERWEAIGGVPLLERYGMTELGMALSNPYRGERRPGTVGEPLPGVKIRRVAEDGGEEQRPDRMAELQVRSPSAFREYLGRAQATADAFCEGWFRTGDLAIEEAGRIRLMGRANRDVLNVGGNLVSALEVEDCFGRHPDISECAVVGVPDDAWGQRVGLVAVAADGRTLPDLDALRAWAESSLAREKLPTRLLEVEELPRNAMGKVRKEPLSERFC